MKIFSLWVLFLYCAAPAASQEKGYDFEIRKGLEIMGAEERPRVIFFMPELKVPLGDMKLDKRYLIKTDEIEKDMDSFIKEEQK